jgi:hypothetical protein
VSGGAEANERAVAGGKRARQTLDHAVAMAPQVMIVKLWILILLGFRVEGYDCKTMVSDSLE